MFPIGINGIWVWDFKSSSSHRSLIIGEMIGQASSINLMSMSPDKVAFLIFNVFVIASTSSALVGERKNE